MEVTSERLRVRLRKKDICAYCACVFLLFLMQPALVNASAGTSSAVDVSIMELRMNPQKFAGRTIMVSGYLREAGGWDTLFLTREHAVMLDFSNAIRIGKIPKPAFSARAHACNQKYVTIRASLRKSEVISQWVISDISLVRKYDMKADITANSKVCWSNR